MNTASSFSAEKIHHSSSRTVDSRLPKTLGLHFKLNTKQELLH